MYGTAGRDADIPSIRSSRLNSPGGLIITTWLVFLLSYALVPISFKRQISLMTYGYLLACLTAFLIGARRGKPANGYVSAGPGFMKDSSGSVAIERAILCSAILGMAGTVFVGIDKVLMGEMDLVQGLGNLRFQLGAEYDPFKTRSPLLWMGTLTYSFSNVSAVLYALCADKVSRRTGLMAGIASFCPLVIAIVYAGRSLELILLLSLFGACLVRYQCGSRFFPKAALFRWMMAVHLILLCVGTIYIFSSRSTAIKDSNASSTLHRYLDVFDATLSPEVEQAVNQDTMTGDFTANLLMLVIYMESPFNELDYLLVDNADAGPFWGRYQVWPLEKSIQMVLGPQRAPELVDLSIHRTGLYFTFWGAVYLDAGVWLGPILAGCVGLLCGYAYRRAIFGGSWVGKLFLPLIYSGIVLTPAHSLFAFGNTWQIIFCSALVSLYLWSRKSTDPGRQDSGRQGSRVTVSGA